MPRKFSVHMHSIASATVTVTVDDAQLARLAELRGVDVDVLTLDDLREWVVDKSFNHTPRICARCSEWGDDRVSLDLNGEWKVDDDENGVELLDAVEEVTGER